MTRERAAAWALPLLATLFFAAGLTSGKRPHDLLPPERAQLGAVPPPPQQLMLPHFSCPACPGLYLLRPAAIRAADVPPWYKCGCKVGDARCICPSLAAPRQLTREQTPQFILLTVRSREGVWFGGSRQHGWLGATHGSALPVVLKPCWMCWPLETEHPICCCLQHDGAINPNSSSAMLAVTRSRKHPNGCPITATM